MLSSMKLAFVVTLYLEVVSRLTCSIMELLSITNMLLAGDFILNVSHSHLKSITYLY